MAPEVLCKQIHSYPVDYYAIGIITYELILGKVIYFILYSDHTMGIIESKFETVFYQNNIFLKNPNFHQDTNLKL